MKDVIKAYEHLILVPAHEAVDYKAVVRVDLDKNDGNISVSSGKAGMVWADLINKAKDGTLTDKDRKKHAITKYTRLYGLYKYNKGDRWHEAEVKKTPLYYADFEEGLDREGVKYDSPDLI